MKEKLKALTKKKSFHMVMLIVIIAIILFVVGIIVLRYNVEGETNMPFELTKMTIISTSEGMDKESTDTKWAFDVYQSNDIYLYIDKNDAYGKTEAIQSVKIDNIQIENKNKENVKIYKPDSQEEKMIFKNKEENNINDIQFQGDMESNLKQLKISNQGGVIAFRVSNNNLSEYKSDEETINHHELLKKAGIAKEQINMKITFDMSIELVGGKEYKATISLDLPIDDVIEKGTTSLERIDLENIVFKRVKNS